MNANLPIPNDDPFARYSAREQARVFTVPAGFADRVEQRLKSRVHRDARGRRFLRFGGMALAASALLGFAIALPRAFRNPPDQAIPNPTEVAAVPNLGEQWSEAGRSLENLTASATQPAVGPAKRLLDSAGTLQLPTADPESPALPKIDFTEVAIEGLKPVTNQPRRAVNAMLRDLGIASNRN